jgi:3-oxoadipate enol-lactonase
MRHAELSSVSFIKADKARIFYRWDGPEGLPTLVLSNSLGTTHAMWDPQIAALTEHFRVLRYDSRGHGQSDVPPGPYNIELLARDVLALLDALELERVKFCGLSIGGMVGIWLGANAAARVERLVLSNTSAHIGGSEVWNSRIETVRKSGMQALVDTVIGRWFTPRFIESSPDTIRRIREMLLSTPPEGYAACAAAVRDMDQRDLLARVAVPALVICGTHDPATPPEHARFIAERVKGARLIELDASHLSNVEAAPAYNRALLGFLTNTN